jgi:hypothetical protein
MRLALAALTPEAKGSALEPMSRAKNPVVWRSALALLVALAHPARAQVCESGRPTDAAGSAGNTYGTAEVSAYDSASGKARVHYALTGIHAVPAASTLVTDVPDAAVVAAQAADDALGKYEELSYLAPLSDVDSPCGSNGGSEAVDIYLIHFTAADGQALPDHCLPGKPRRCSGFVLVENDFKNSGYKNTEEGLRTVVPHELFHLVQDAYDADVERWWAEGSAQWAAKQVYPELHDLERFLPAYFKNPWRPLNVPPNGVITDFLYATAIWPVFLQERFDASVVREVFESFDGGSEVLPPTGTVLQARGSSLAQEFLQFAAYNAATGSRAPDSGGYSQAPSYPEVPFTVLTSTSGDLVSDVGSGLGAFYYSLTTNAPTDLSLDADPARVAGLVMPVQDGKVLLSEAKALPASSEGEAVVLVAGQDLGRTDAPFTLRGQPSGAPKSDGPGESGCATAVGPARASSWGGAGLGFVVILLGRSRARMRWRGTAGPGHQRKGRCR